MDLHPLSQYTGAIRGSKHWKQQGGLAAARFGRRGGSKVQIFELWRRRRITLTNLRSTRFGDDDVMMTGSVGGV